MGGLFLLSRHVAVHTGIEGDKPNPIWKDWESKAYYFGVLPGMLLILGAGVGLIVWGITDANMVNYLDPDGPWGATFHLKLTLIVVLLGLDQFFHFKMRKFHKTGEGGKGAFMAVHGVTAIMFVAISFLAVYRFGV
jgi:uncharacterized membrane protein